MLAQRGADLARDQRRPPPEKAPKETASVRQPSDSARRRLTFKDQHALETLPNTIAGLRKEAETLQQRLSDPQFYARDRTVFERTSIELGELERKIATAEEQWLELEILREELAGGR
jgi:ATP-binding cassette subfamily F protein uup